MYFVPSPPEPPAKLARKQIDSSNAVVKEICIPFADTVLGDLEVLKAALLSGLPATIPTGSRVVTEGSGLGDARVFIATEEQEACLLVDRFTAFKARAQSLVGDTRSEETVLTCITEITGIFWKMLSVEVQLQELFTYSYNKIDASGATEAGLRPDETDYLNDFLISKSEHKELSLQAARNDLLAKLTGYNTTDYGVRIVYLPVIAAASTSIEYALIDVRTKQYHPIVRYDLSQGSKATVDCFVMAINFFRLFRTMAPYIPDTANPLFKVINGVRFLNDSVLKKLGHTTCPDELYQLLREGNVTNAVTVVRTRRHLQVSPVGVRSPSRGLGFSERYVQLAVTAVLGCLAFLHSRGFVHRDIRWDNIIRKIGSSAGEPPLRFLVIDFEFAATSNTPMTINSYIHQHVVGFGDLYRPEHDLVLVAELVETWATSNNLRLSHDALDFVRSLKARELTAHDAQLHVWLQ